MRLPFLLLLPLFLIASLPASLSAQEKGNDERIFELEAALIELKTEISRRYYVRGEEAFFDKKFDDAIRAWDREIELAPKRAPHHWQRGLSLYYADRFADGAKQFETHQTVNGTDVENAAWHYLCLCKTAGQGKNAADKALYPFAGDRRRPMREIHALFAGTGSEKDVLSACGKERNALCYGHFYLGLHHEALGRTKEALEHFKKAGTSYSMDHYMGKVAKIHYELRKNKDLK